MIKTFAIFFLVTATVAGGAQANEELENAERDWLAAYTNNDKQAMDLFLANGFRITFPDGRINQKGDVISGLDPSDGVDSTPHFTRDRTIRLLGDTAILSGVYVSPSDDPDNTEPELEWRYTDTWMKLDGRWQVVASHLSFLQSPSCQ